MEESSRKGLRRRDVIRGGAVAAAATALPLAPSTARADGSGSLPGFCGHDGMPDPLPKYKTDRAAIDMGKTYANPVSLPNIEVRTGTSTVAPTDAGIANSTTMLPILAKPTWVEADGRSLLRASKTGFRVVTENASGRWPTSPPSITTARSTSTAPEICRPTGRCIRPRTI